MSKFIITGLTSGIGYSLALKALNEGHEVLGILRRFKEFSYTDSYACLIESGNVSFFEWDMEVELTPELRSELTDRLRHLQRLDFIFHFAGYLEGGPWESIKPERFQSQLQVNVLGVHSLTQLCLPYLQEGGKIYAAGSVAGHFSYPLIGPYCVSKHALRSMFDSWYFEASFQHIQFCHISLGPVQTPFWEKSRRGHFEPNHKFSISREAFIQISRQIEARALTIDSVVHRLWKSLRKKKLPQDWVLVKNILFDYYLIKIIPLGIRKAVISKLLQFPKSR